MKIKAFLIATAIFGGICLFAYTLCLALDQILVLLVRLKQLFTRIALLQIICACFGCTAIYGFYEVVLHYLKENE